MLTRILKSVVATAVLGGALFFAAAPKAQAADRDDHRDRDRDRIVRYDHRDDRGRFDRDDYRPARREHFVRGWYDQFGCFHRY